MRSRFDPVVVAMLAAFAALSLPSLLGESPTFDEPYHVAQGFRYLMTGDASFMREVHPPGFQALAAVPLRLAGVPLDPLPLEDPESLGGASSSIGAFFRADSGRVLHLFPWSRAVVLVTTLLLGWVLAREAARAYGVWGARLSITLFVLDPNVIAHGKLVTTDAAAMTADWFVLLALARWARAPGARRAVVVGLALGAALLCKFSTALTGALLLPFGAMLSLRRVPLRLPSVARDAVLVYGTAFLCIWTTHGFAVGPVEPRRHGPTAHSGTMEMARDPDQDLAAETSPVRRLEGRVLPAPTYFQGMLEVSSHVYRRGHPAYLMGRHSRTGWRAYFPIAFAIKTPLPTLLLILAGLLSFGVARPTREEWMWLAFVGIYVASAIRGSLNIGYRHLLPILPPLMLLVGRFGSARLRDVARSAAARAVAALLLVWLATETVVNHRHPLAYFNEIVGGPRNGWKYLVDASLDWGQDLPGLARWLAEHRVDSVRLSYYGTVDPSQYGIPWVPVMLPPGPDGGKPAPDQVPAGTYAISASRLVEAQTLGRGPLTVFQAFRPVATIGHSIFVYEVQ